MLRLKWNNFMTANPGIIYMIEACRAGLPVLDVFDDLRLDADREVQVPGMETAETSKVSKN